MRPAAARGRNTRHDDHIRPFLSTRVGTSRADSSGGSSPTAARWAPQPSAGASASQRTVVANAGVRVSTDVEVTMPSRWAWRIAFETPSVRP